MHDYALVFHVYGDDCVSLPGSGDGYGYDVRHHDYARAHAPGHHVYAGVHAVP